MNPVYPEMSYKQGQDNQSNGLSKNLWNAPTLKQWELVYKDLIFFIGHKKFKIIEMSHYW